MASLRYNHNLTHLYNDTKQKALINADKTVPNPASTKLNRKLHAQKDRLVTWGLEWREETNDSIDEAVGRAGLTETVTSVLGNIKEVLDQANRLQSRPLTSDKAAFDQDRYQDLLRDFTSSVDVLYDLSASRRAIARGTHPTFGDYPHEVAKHGFHTGKIPFDAASFASSELTLVNPQFTRPTLSPYAGLPAGINPNALLLPAEAPPPYENMGIPSTSRMMARLSKSMAPESVRNVFSDVTDEYVSVMVEFSNYDALYRDTGVPPPLTRVERLAAAINNTSSKSALRLLGYVEDSGQPRIGLVYDYRGVHNIQSSEMQPVTLLSLILNAHKATRPVDISNATPFLEDRFRIALRIVERLRDLHVENYYHGNLHSESIVFVHQGQSSQLRKSELQRPVVSAFDLFSRNRIEYTDTPAAANITRHPDDNGGEVDEVTAIRYDLYSLGLILMEIGLWTPLNDFFKQKYTLRDFQLRLEKLYIPKLASKCGSIYLRAVQTCLRYAESDDVERIGVDSVYESIIGKLQRCCLLDENESIEIMQIPAGFMQDQSNPEPSTLPKKKTSIWDSRKEESGASLPSVTSSSVVAPRSPILSMLSLKSNRSNSMGMDTSKHDPLAQVPSNVPADMNTLPTATDQTQTPSRVAANPLPCSFREYRRKVVLIQSRWRERRRQKLESRCTSLEESRTPTLTNQRTPALSDQRSITSTNRCRIFPVKLPKSIIDEWHTEIGLRLSCIIERALKGSPESSSIDLVSVGTDAFSAKPTIIVTCNNTARVKAALKRKFQYDKSMFDLKVRQGRIALSRGKSNKTCNDGGDGVKRSHLRGDVGESIKRPMNPFWQERPLCGASIGAYLPEHGHLEPVSLGGIIEIDNRHYGMSVHHMLEPPSSDEYESSGDESSGEDGTEQGKGGDTRQGAQRSSAKPLRSQSGYTSDLSSISSSSSDTDTDGYTSSEFEEEEEETSEDGNEEDVGDRPGINPVSSHHSGIEVTQPAFNDAVAQDLHADDATAEELDEDHLTSYRLGKVFASSGLRRLKRGDGRRVEIDWVLLELDPPRLQPLNQIRDGRQYCNDMSFPSMQQDPSAKSDWFPTSIMTTEEESSLADTKVHCLGRTSGLQTGVVGAAMSFVKIRGRRTFSVCWSVLGEFGVGGDSGAWILSNATGRVLGHVLAEHDGLTYLCCMDDLFEDMKTTLGVGYIGLPLPEGLTGGGGGGGGGGEKSGVGMVVDESGGIGLLGHGEEGISLVDGDRDDEDEENGDDDEEEGRGQARSRGGEQIIPSRGKGNNATEEIKRKRSTKGKKQECLGAAASMRKKALERKSKQQLVADVKKIEHVEQVGGGAEVKSVAPTRQRMDWFSDPSSPSSSSAARSLRS